MLETTLRPKDARVLLVEDSPNDQEIVTRALKSFGIGHWRLAKSGEDALKEVARNTYDVVFLDYSLPGVNGLELLKYLGETAPNTSVILVSGVRQERIAVTAMQMGAIDFLSKDDYLTSGIIRSLQAALRRRASSALEEQREKLSVRGDSVSAAIVEGSWLIQAMDQRHGYRPHGKGYSDPLEEHWTEALDSFTTYVRESQAVFPEPATEFEDDVIRKLIASGASPRDICRIYVAAIQNLESGGGNDSGTSIRPIFFLAHIFACMIEETQVMLLLANEAAFAQGGAPNGGTPER